MTTEAGTMSAAVDEVVLRTGRPDSVRDIVAWLRSTIRECQVQAFFEHDLVEEQLIATADPWVWQQPAWFRQMRTVEYPSVLDMRGSYVKPRFVLPGRAHTREMARVRYFYYAAQQQYVFAGVSSIMHTLGFSTAGEYLINLAYYEYSRPLAYIETVSERPARWILETGQWEYNTVDGVDYGSTPELQEQARENVSNWLLFKWFDAVIEGTVAKVFKAKNDTRNALAYAQFTGYKADIMRGESRTTMAGEI